jgi:hypothetical protein
MAQVKHRPKPERLTGTASLTQFSEQAVQWTLSSGSARATAHAPPRCGSTPTTPATDGFRARCRLQPQLWPRKKAVWREGAQLRQHPLTVSLVAKLLYLLLQRLLRSRLQVGLQPHARPRNLAVHTLACRADTSARASPLGGNRGAVEFIRARDRFPEARATESALAPGAQIHFPSQKTWGGLQNPLTDDRAAGGEPGSPATPPQRQIPRLSYVDPSYVVWLTGLTSHLNGRTRQSFQEK